MKLKDVPQDCGMGEDQKEVTYAVDENGCYVLAPSLGWGPKNITNQQAWETIALEVSKAVIDIQEGKASPLAYHMAVHQMDIRLLASYVGFCKFKVKRHLKPKIFHRLKPYVIKRYAEVFGIPAEDIGQIPKKTPPSLRMHCCAGE